MLPAGLVAQPADHADQQHLLARHPTARIVVRLLVGACACDLVRARRPDPREDERYLRARYRRAGTERGALIAAIDRHRRGTTVPTPPGDWPRALAAFVAEHARNAGDTLYLLRFGMADLAAAVTLPVRAMRAGEVLARPEGWLEEDVPVLVGT
jgi:hypothetical protein